MPSLFELSRARAAEEEQAAQTTGARASTELKIPTPDPATSADPAPAESTGVPAPRPANELNPLFRQSLSQEVLNLPAPSDQVPAEDLPDIPSLESLLPKIDPTNEDFTVKDEPDKTQTPGIEKPKMGTWNDEALNSVMTRRNMLAGDYLRKMFLAKRDGLVENGMAPGQAAAVSYQQIMENKEDFKKAHFYADDIVYSEMLKQVQEAGASSTVIDKWLKSAGEGFTSGGTKRLGSTMTPIDHYLATMPGDLRDELLAQDNGKKWLNRWNSALGFTANVTGSLPFMKGVNTVWSKGAARLVGKEKMIMPMWAKSVAASGAFTSLSVAQSIADPDAQLELAHIGKSALLGAFLPWVNKIPGIGNLETAATNTAAAGKLIGQMLPVGLGAATADMVGHWLHGRSWSDLSGQEKSAIFVNVGTLLAFHTVGGLSGLAEMGKMQRQMLAKLEKEGISPEQAAKFALSKDKAGELLDLKVKERVQQEFEKSQEKPAEPRKEGERRKEPGEVPEGEQERRKLADRRTLAKQRLNETVEMAKLDKTVQEQLITREMKTIESNEKITYKAEHDKLTDMINLHGAESRNYVDKEGKVNVDHVYIDLDNFKPTNDGFSHAAGNTALKLFTESLNTHLIKTGLAKDLYRIGGDEFGVIKSEGTSNKALLAGIGLARKQYKETTLKFLKGLEPNPEGKEIARKLLEEDQPTFTAAFAKTEELSEGMVSTFKKKGKGKFKGKTFFEGKVYEPDIKIVERGAGAGKQGLPELPAEPREVLSRAPKNYKELDSQIRAAESEIDRLTATADKLESEVKPGQPLGKKREAEVAALDKEVERIQNLQDQLLDIKTDQERGQVKLDTEALAKAEDLFAKGKGGREKEIADLSEEWRGLLDKTGEPLPENKVRADEIEARIAELSTAKFDPGSVELAKSDFVFPEGQVKFLRTPAAVKYSKVRLLKMDVGELAKVAESLEVKVDKATLTDPKAKEELALRILKQQAGVPDPKDVKAEPGITKEEKVDIAGYMDGLQKQEAAATVTGKGFSAKKASGKKVKRSKLAQQVRQKELDREMEEADNAKGKSDRIVQNTFEVGDSEIKVTEIKESKLSKMYVMMKDHLYNLRRFPELYLTGRTMGGLAAGKQKDHVRDLVDMKKGPFRDMDNQDYQRMSQQYWLKNYANWDELGMRTSDVTATMAYNQLNKLKQKWGPEKYEFYEKRGAELAKMNDELLDFLVDMEYIHEDLAVNLKKKYDHFLRTEVLDTGLDHLLGEGFSTRAGIGRVDRGILNRKLGTTKKLEKDLIKLTANSISRKVIAGYKQRFVNDVAQEVGTPIGITLWNEGKVRVPTEKGGEFQSTNVYTKLQTDVLPEYLKAKVVPAGHKKMASSTRKPNANEIDWIMETFSKDVKRNMVNRLKVDSKSISTEQMRDWVKDHVNLQHAIPETIHNMMDGVENISFDVVTRAMGAYNNIFKAGATTQRYAFIFTNPMRDLQDFLFRSKVKGAKASRTEVLGHASVIALAEAFGVETKTLREMREAGTDFGGLYNSIGRSVQKPLALESPGKQKIRITKEAILLPIITLPEKLGKAGERLTRTAEWLRAKSAGIPNKEAALLVRDISIDFQKMGTVGRVFNTWVPFFNAAIQGTGNTARFIKERPLLAAGRTAATVIAPYIALKEWNTSFEADVDIPKNIKEREWYWIIPDIEALKNGQLKAALVTNEDGSTVPVLLTAKKSEWAAAVTGTVDAVLGQALFPQDIEKLREVSTGKALASVAMGWASEWGLSAAPPLPRTALEVASGYNFYYKQPLVSPSVSKRKPEHQVRSGTPNLPRRIGEAVHVSPEKLNHMVTSILPQTKQWLSTVNPLFESSGPDATNYSIRGNKIETASKFLPLAKTPHFKETRTIVTDFKKKFMANKTSLAFLIEDRAARMEEALQRGDTAEEDRLDKNLEYLVEEYYKTVEPNVKKANATLNGIYKKVQDRKARKLENMSGFEEAMDDASGVIQKAFVREKGDILDDIER